ncbi:unnamed protein product [Phytophthora fragariaefolia]|uniref:Unnamed protein product n=1 Tax=Phytophthora fragariaefolia TaxID=1490495 RepID=A0A9W7D5S3_9STRA|nr:unnamed protein product [Phytophthora fragariaefolia]
MKSPHLSQRMARWLSFFAEYNFVVHYKPGKNNILADALSRRPDYDPRVVLGRQVIDDEDDNDDYAGRDYADPCEDLAAQVRRSYQHEDDDGAQRIKLTHHISLSKLSKFNGKRNRSERSLRWLKKFIYEMEGTNTPQDRWCEPFQLCMEGGASNWIRQRPKKTRLKWSRLCEAFMAYYCSQYDQSAEDRYYTAKRDEDEHICDYLLRLNRYARSAKIMYETGGPAGARHDKRFRDTCEDDALVRQLIPQRFDNIAKVEAVINDTMAPIADEKTEGIARASPPVKEVRETTPDAATIAEPIGKIAEPIGKIAEVTAEVAERTDTAAKLRSPRHQSTSCTTPGRAAWLLCPDVEQCQTADRIILMVMQIGMRIGWGLRRHRGDWTRQHRWANRWPESSTRIHG